MAAAAAVGMAAGTEWTAAADRNGAAAMSIGTTAMRRKSPAASPAMMAAEAGTTGGKGPAASLSPAAAPGRSGSAGATRPRPASFPLRGRTIPGSRAGTMARTVDVSSKPVCGMG